MELYRKRKTDAEFVKHLENQYNKRWRFFYILVAISLTLLFFTFYLAHKHDQLKNQFLKSLDFGDSEAENPYTEYIKKLETDPANKKIIEYVKMIKAEESAKRSTENMKVIQKISDMRIGFNFYIMLWGSLFGLGGSFTLVINRRKDKLLIDTHKKLKELQNKSS